MTRPDWRAVALVLVLSAVWWFFTLARGCGPSRPTEITPATTPATR
jgi:hypothetical protein